MVIVWPVVVALKVVVREVPIFHTVPARSDIEPLIVGPADMPLAVKVTVPAETVMSLHRPPLTVTV